MELLEIEVDSIELDLLDDPDRFKAAVWSQASLVINTKYLTPQALACFCINLKNVRFYYQRKPSGLLE